MTRSFTFLGITLAAAVPALAQTLPPSFFEYAADDGTGFTESSLSAYDARVTWGNYFYATDPFSTITTIRVSFARDVMAGKAIQVGVWNDPDDDGDPRNATLIGLANHVVAGPTGPTDFADFAIDPAQVSGGFFVAAIADLDRDEVALRQDFTTPGATSWRFDNGVGEDNFDLGSAGFGGRLADFGLGTWMVRAVGVPNPGTAVTLLGCSAFAFRRRRR